MKKIIEAIKRAVNQPDKWKHFAVGAAIFVLALPFVGISISYVIVCAVAIIKEMWDKAGHGISELADIFAAMAGALAMLLAIVWYIIFFAIVHDLL